MNTLSVELKKPVTFANFPETIKESECPDLCPICGAPTIKNIYSVDCGDLDNCEWYADFEEETEPEAPDRYDWVMNK